MPAMKRRTLPRVTQDVRKKSVTSFIHEFDNDAVTKPEQVLYMSMLLHASKRDAGDYRHNSELYRQDHRALLQMLRVCPGAKVDLSNGVTYDSMMTAEAALSPQDLGACARRMMPGDAARTYLCEALEDRMNELSLKMSDHVANYDVRYEAYRMTGAELNEKHYPLDTVLNKLPHGTLTHVPADMFTDRSIVRQARFTANEDHMRKTAQLCDGAQLVRDVNEALNPTAPHRMAGDPEVRTWDYAHKWWDGFCKQAGCKGFSFDMAATDPAFVREPIVKSLYVMGLDTLDHVEDACKFECCTDLRNDLTNRFENEGRVTGEFNPVGPYQMPKTGADLAAWQRKIQGRDIRAEVESVERTKNQVVQPSTGFEAFTAESLWGELKQSDAPAKQSEASEEADKFAEEMLGEDEFDDPDGHDLEKWNREDGVSYGG